MILQETSQYPCGQQVCQSLTVEPSSLGIMQSDQICLNPNGKNYKAPRQVAKFVLVLSRFDRQLPSSVSNASFGTRVWQAGSCLPCGSCLKENGSIPTTTNPSCLNTVKSKSSYTIFHITKPFPSPVPASPFRTRIDITSLGLGSDNPGESPGSSYRSHQGLPLARGRCHTGMMEQVALLADYSRRRDLTSNP